MSPEYKAGYLPITPRDPVYLVRGSRLLKFGHFVLVMTAEESSFGQPTGPNLAQDF